jgi:hypothetical protein
LIQISKPRSTKKTKREETPASSAIERLTSEIVNFRAHSSTDQLRDLRDTLRSDDLSMLEHQAKLVDFAEKYAEYLEKKEAGLIQTENFILVIREKAYANCNAQVKSLEKQIESTKRNPLGRRHLRQVTLQFRPPLCFLTELLTLLKRMRNLIWMMMCTLELMCPNVLQMKRFQRLKSLNKFYSNLCLINIYNYLFVSSSL